uniref:ABC transporter permease n=1 Tax=Macrostomum lignano TaxID=282301 RepID=A0A1I8J1Z3_9PLAT
MPTMIPFNRMFRTSVGQQSYDYVLIHLFEDSYERKLDHTITALLRTTVSFIGISLLMMVLSNVFAVYSLKHPRYTFKRAAAALYGMTNLPPVTEKSNECPTQT